MLRSLLVPALMAAATLAAGNAAAQDRVTLGYGRLFTNDYIGDGHDRWRTGAYTWSVIRGPEWQGDLPGRLGQIMEYRAASQIVAPMRVRADSVDRPYVGRLSFGVHSHAQLGPFEVSLGADLVVLGPQTRLADGQKALHDLFGFSGPHGTDFQIGNAVRLAGTAELAWPLHLSDRVLLRPFAEAQAGVEDTMRVGADVIVGHVGQSDLFTRDNSTGHLIRAVTGPEHGFALVAGADWTQVGNSLYLPADEGYSAIGERWRTRLGVHWQVGPQTSFFYGLTRLSEEFDGQDEGQTLGSLKLNFNF